MTRTPIAETERLLIRPWRLEEAPRVLDILSRLEVVQWLGDDEPVLMKDLAEARERISRYPSVRSQVPPLGFWAIEVDETGGAAGSVLLLDAARTPSTTRSRSAGTCTRTPGGTATPTEAAAAVLAYGLAYGPARDLRR